MLLPLIPLLLGFQKVQAPGQKAPQQKVPQQKAAVRQERTVFQTLAPYSDRLNLRADVAIVYGFDAGMPARVKSWRDRGYKVHLMTGVAWGDYQDYYFGRWDGKIHEDEAQARSNGEKIGHGRDVYYLSPGIDYGKYLAEGVRKALDVGVEAVHLEEPEFWVYGGYGAGFKREWQDYYKEPWQDPASSPDARWRTAKLMSFLYRRALEQIFADIVAYNKEKGTSVRCYVPTHSLLNYADWGIVSPESDLAKIEGCDGYIAQVWTGTAREPNRYRNVKKERTFETAFLEYGSMQNLVRSTGRSVWYLADPIEDNPNHDWGDYRRNYRSTLVASLLQPDVSNYEVMPWPERIYNDSYPAESEPGRRVRIPGSYATELQVVINALKDMEQPTSSWESGSRGVGVVVSDSLMFQRGGPSASDDDFGHFYGLALPFLKRGMPVAPIQLENVNLPGYLSDTKILLMSYEGQKPLSPSVHEGIADWVQAGGTLVFVDDDKDPFHAVREWWNSGDSGSLRTKFATPREHLFQRLGVGPNPAQELTNVGKGRLLHLKMSPSADISRKRDGDKVLVDRVRAAAKEFAWSESSSLVLRRGPYVVAAGMDETDSPSQTLKGEYVDLFDATLAVKENVALGPESRHLLVDLARWTRPVVASAGYVEQKRSDRSAWIGTMEGQADTPGILLLRTPAAPKGITLDGGPLTDTTYDAARRLLWLRFPNAPRPRKIEIRY